jgi:hypothetical protein
LNDQCLRAAGTEPAFEFQQTLAQALPRLCIRPVAPQQRRQPLAGFGVVWPHGEISEDCPVFLSWKLNGAAWRPRCLSLETSKKPQVQERHFRRGAACAMV